MVEMKRFRVFSSVSFQKVSEVMTMALVSRKNSIMRMAASFVPDFLVFNMGSSTLPAIVSLALQKRRSRNVSAWVDSFPYTVLARKMTPSDSLMEAEALFTESS